MSIAVGKASGFRPKPNGKRPCEAPTAGCGHGETWKSRTERTGLACRTATRSALVSGSFQTDKSPYGVMDGAGNVMEWVDDWYQEAYYKESPDKNPPSPEYRDLPSHEGGRVYDDRGRSSDHQSEQNGAGFSR